MNLQFLPPAVWQAINCLNINSLSEIRIRKGQPVMIEYSGAYEYLNTFGSGGSSGRAIKVNNVEDILSEAIGGNIFAYSEQLKNACVTLDGGIRVGICGECVTEGGKVVAIRSVTSLNIRIPHDVPGCAKDFKALFRKTGVHSLLLFSNPGLGKTTMLRDLAKLLATKCNVLVFDERNEISAMDGYGNGYDLGERCDIIRGGNKRVGFENAIRTMKPEVIVTDELYGDSDLSAVKYAVDCGIAVMASTHITDRLKLQAMPFAYYAELTAIGKPPFIYDKNFNLISDHCADDVSRLSSID